jgi:anaerobic selenocysteine-containing dehydrogenase
LPPTPQYSATPQEGDVAARLASSKLLFLDGQNPSYTLPLSAGVRQALEKQDAIVSFGPFIDDSAAYADWILPGDHYLEAASAVVPLTSPRPAITVSIPVIQPLYQTRPLEQTLAGIANKMGTDFVPVTPDSYVKPFLSGDESWEQVARQGGFWPNGASDRETPRLTAHPRQAFVAAESATFHGDPTQFPLYFQPYLSLQYGDGGGANLPWMQELPDPTSSAMWNVPVEIDSQTAARINVSTGDWVRIESPGGELEAPVYVHPAAIPGVVSMAVGEGHTRYGRYASGRGANPISILAAVSETATGILATGSTRVRLSRLEKPREELVQFSPRDREQAPWGYR